MDGCASWCRLEDDSQKFSEGVLAEDFVSEDLDFLQDIVLDGRCSPISIKVCLEDKVPCIKIMGSTIDVKSSEYSVDFREGQLGDSDTAKVDSVRDQVDENVSLALNDEVID